MRRALAWLALPVLLAVAVGLVLTPVLAQTVVRMFGTQTDSTITAVAVDSSGRINVTLGSGSVACANGGTGITSYAVGDLIYASAAPCTLSKLADVATGQVLVSGGVGVAPAYSATPTVTTLTAIQNSIAAVATDGLISQNTQASTVLVTAQQSPRLRFAGTGWDSDDAISRTADMWVQLLPSTGTTIASALQIQQSIAGGGATTPFSLSNGGSLTIGGTLNAGTNVVAASTGAFLLGSRGGLAASADGVFNLANNATTGCTSVSIGADLVYGCAVPTITSGFSTSTPAIAGRASSFAVTIKTTPGVTGLVAFNQTFTNVPSVTCSNTITANLVQAVPTVTTVVLNGVWVNGDIIRCAAIGY